MIQSIRGRFLIVSVITVLLAMTLAGIVFVELFSRSLERRIHQELTDHINNIAGALRISADGTLQPPDRPMDPRFDRPYGGIYWQVEDDKNGTQLRSASLWDFVLALPEDQQRPGEIDRYHLQGPDNTDLIVQEQMIIFAAPGGERAVRVAVGVDAATLEEARKDFAGDIIPYMAALATVLIAASLAQLTFGLRPLFSVSDGLNAIRERRAERLTGSYPQELRGVVGAVNRLLDAQADTIAKARSRAADLAHGLKTPLTVLSNDAETLKERGQEEIGDELSHLATVMRAHVDRELNRSRLAADTGLAEKTADLSLAVERIVRTLRRTPRGEMIEWAVSVAHASSVPLDQQDLEEMLGNILDNAEKWARGQVAIRFDPQTARLTIADDGPGADPKQLPNILTRGVRLDLNKPGTGLGLAIVRDIADAYDIHVSAENGETGGLEIIIDFSTPSLGATATQPESE